jgi:hypothetical protein
MHMNMKDDHTLLLKNNKVKEQHFYCVYQVTLNVIV